MKSLPTLPIQLFTFSAKRFSSSAASKIFLLNVVSRITVCVVVMNGLLDGVPRIFSGHVYITSFFDV